MKIPVSNDFREDVNTMCNLAEGIEERAVERTKKETINNVIVNMYKQGCSSELIANVTGTSVDNIETVIKEKSPAMA